jgi:hypothetical protein
MEIKARIDDIYKHWTKLSNNPNKLILQNSRKESYENIRQLHAVRR